MFQTLKNAWKIEELRNKILFTLLIILIFRLGNVIPVPFLDPEAIKAFIEVGKQTIFGFLDVMSGGAFSQATVFALSISPYITASIIIQLLAIAIPALERIAKEGPEGKKKLGRITRYAAIGLAAVQGFGYYAVLERYGAVNPRNPFTITVIVATFTAGSCLLIWLAERIDEKGVGNGISMILFAGIVAGGPDIVQNIIRGFAAGTMSVWAVIVLVIGAAAVMLFVVHFHLAERRIPIQYAKRVVGRKMYGGQNSHLPLKVNMTGVLPVIFSSSIASLPATIAMFFPAPAEGTFWYGFQEAFAPDSWLYAIIYFVLIIFFNYFYTAVQFNPIEIANNMKKNGGFVPGIRPGKPTSDFITKVLNKITLMGAFFLAIIAAVPIILSGWLGQEFALGGTSLLILVGVALETVKQLESQMLMRHYKGFLE